MRMKSALRKAKKDCLYWMAITERDEVLIRERFFDRAKKSKKPSGFRKAMAALVVKHFRPPVKLRILEG